jgi:TPR repeat protein
MAMMAIGNRYQYDHDYANALVWFHKAADTGKTKATLAGITWGMTSMGAAYEYGQGVEKDYRQAAAWYRRAADLGSRDGMYYLGTLYERGLGVSQDQQTAIDWYRKSAKLGLGDAEVALRRLGVAQE